MKDNKIKIESYIWKNKKDLNNSEQSSVKMIDMNEETLREKYNHCKTMLMNNSREHPGRYVVLDEISRQINDCGAELLIRWFETLECNPKYTRFTLLTEIRNALQNNKDTFADQEVKMQNIFSGLPSELNGVTISSVIRGCKDTLGRFNRKHITKTFIIKQGIWFTAQESKEFTEISQAKTMSEKLTVVKERLGINMALEVSVKATGLSYAQFRSMILLGTSKKYSELTTLQLETLRYKVLFTLEEEVFFHIRKWETLMSQIECTAEYREFKL